MNWFKRASLGLATSMSLLYSMPSYSQLPFTSSQQRQEIQEKEFRTEIQEIGKEIIEESLDLFMEPFVYLRGLGYKEKLSDVKDNEGNPWFSYENTHLLSRCNIPLPYIRNCVDYKNEDGNPLVPPEYIIPLFVSGLSESYIQETLDLFLEHNENLPNAESLIKYYHLCPTEDELFFHNTEKPDSVLILPESDILGLAFYNDSSLEFYKGLRDNYDTLIRVVGEDEEFYNSLEYEVEQGADPKLLVLAGHGSNYGIGFSDKYVDLKFNFFNLIKIEILYQDERGNLDKNDKDLERYLNLLDNDATIFLLSCLNYQDGCSADNFGNFISEKSNQRRVIGASEKFSVNKILVNSFYPLDVIILNDQWEDITVTNSLDEESENLPVTNYPLFGSKPLKTKEQIRIDRLLRPRFPD